MVTDRQRLEVFVDGSLVYTTREPAAPFEGEPIQCARDAVPWFTSIQAMPQEVFAVMSLTSAGRPIRTRWITVGILDGTVVHPREVFADPLTDRAAGVILAHNPPSGTLEPSPEDLELTKRLAKAGSILGIRVLDHLILSSGGFVSLKERGEM